MTIFGKRGISTKIMWQPCHPANCFTDLSATNVYFSVPWSKMSNFRHPPPRGNRTLLIKSSNFFFVTGGFYGSQIFFAERISHFSFHLPTCKIFFQAYKTTRFLLPFLPFIFELHLKSSNFFSHFSHATLYQLNVFLINKNFQKIYDTAPSISFFQR